MCEKVSSSADISKAESLSTIVMGHQGHHRFGIIRWWRAVLLFNCICLVWGHCVSHWGNHKSKVIVYVPPSPKSFVRLWRIFETGTSLGFVTFHESSETPVELIHRQTKEVPLDTITINYVLASVKIYVYEKSLV